MSASVTRPPRVKLIDEAAIRDLVAGATLLGTGGGGDPRIGALMALDAIRAHGPVAMIGIEDLAEGSLVTPVAMIGAPTVILERVPGGHELESVVNGFEQIAGRPVAATMPIEAGGINSTFPVVLAARRGLPLVDGDGMGRAFPEVQMVTLGAGGARAWPLVLADESGNVVTVADAADNAAAERMARSVVVGMGGSAIVAHYAVDTALLREWAVPGSLSLAIAIGQQLRLAQGDGLAAIDAIAPLCGARRLFTGKITDVDRTTRAGFVHGDLHLLGIDQDAGHTCEVDFQNENLVVRRDGEILAAVPDLISLIDADSGRPMTTEGVRFGIRTHVVGTPCSPLWWRPEALPLVQPRAFGYDIDPVKLEPLQ
jgi:DUF917 family protein